MIIFFCKLWKNGVPFVAQYMTIIHVYHYILYTNPELGSLIWRSTHHSHYKLLYYFYLLYLLDYKIPLFTKRRFRALRGEANEKYVKIALEYVSLL